MRTPGRRSAGKQLRGQARGSAGRSGSAPAAEHPPSARALQQALIQTVLGFLQNSPKFLTEEKNPPK